LSPVHTSSVKLRAFVKRVCHRLALQPDRQLDIPSTSYAKDEMP